MAFFDRFKKKLPPRAAPEAKLLLAMPLFRNGDRYGLSAVIGHLRGHWGLDVSGHEGDDDAAVLTIGDNTVALAYLPAPVPPLEIEALAPYAYNWPGVAAELDGHSGHALLSVMGDAGSPLARYRLLSMLLHSVLATSAAVGVYQGRQSLLLPRDQYLESAPGLAENKVPVDLWLYIGLQSTATGNSIYTVGMGEFGKPELEVIDSKRELEELYHFIVNICAYVIVNDVALRNGETLGYTADQKIRITLSEGRFVEGETLKLAM
ncbi:MAG: DUF4261 domain-containing protein [Chitinophagaceae bacterium]|nr:MAG: DUF4261 domain-containing protein [Chitinophagaceae bacterium]